MHIKIESESKRERAREKVSKAKYSERIYITFIHEFQI